MSLVEYLPGGLDPAGNVVFSGLTDLRGMRWEIQAVNLPGGSTNTTTIAANTGAASLVLIAGTAASVQTINLPASPGTGDLYLIAVTLTASITFSGNGQNINGTASLSASGPGCLSLIFDGSQWTSFLFDGMGGASRSIVGPLSINGRVTRGGQSFATNGGTIGTIVSSAGSYIGISGTSGGAIQLPASPVSGQEYFIQDEGGNAGTNNIVISGNGKTVCGASTLAMATNYRRISLRYNGSGWYGG